jgi:hypothetical protein
MNNDSISVVLWLRQLRMAKKKSGSLLSSKVFVILLSHVAVNVMTHSLGLCLFWITGIEFSPILFTHHSNNKKLIGIDQHLQ